MPKLSDNDITFVRERSDIERVVSEVVSLRGRGDALKGLCPFHEEKTPSFTVNTSRNLWHCFGCGEGGDVIAFLQKAHSLPFVDAVENLADRIGYHLSTIEHVDEQVTVRRRRLLDMNMAAATFYRHQLTSDEGAVAVAFLTERGFTVADADLFECGYAPLLSGALGNHLTGRGFTVEEMVEAGLVGKSETRMFDRFRGRLMFPIKNTSHEIIGFGGRKLHPDKNKDRPSPKYLNTPETALYRKSHVLFGLDKARQSIAKRDHTGTSTVVVVEGYTDVMACHAAGITNVVAACGTAFGRDHAHLLSRLMGAATRKHIIYLFDGDNAGQKAATKALRLDDVFAEASHAVILPDNLDPCDVRTLYGDERLQQLLDGHEPLVGIVLKAAIGTINLDRPETQADAVAACTPLLAALKTEHLRTTYMRLVATWTAVNIHTVQAAVARNTHKQDIATVLPETLAPTPESVFTIPPPHDPWLRLERVTIQMVVNDPDLHELWESLIEIDDYLHPTYRALAATPHSGDPVLDSVRRSLLVDVHPNNDEEAVTGTFTVFALNATRRRMTELNTAASSQAATAEMRHEHTRLAKRLQTLQQHSLGHAV